MGLQSDKSLINNIGVVVIGRNEGERLVRCLKSIASFSGKIVYVDSGSTDGSVDYAKSINIDVVELDMDMPFSAGRARNAGFFFLLGKYPTLTYVQFVDGDCELHSKWLNSAVQFLTANDSCAVVAGRRKEKYPENSVYNLLCDIEWNTPVGVASSCGGDFCIRVHAFAQMNGFNPFVIAGEEPDLCYRLRQNKWSIHRLGRPMTFHDAAITRFSQWWKRAVRSGHAYAQGYILHRKDGLGFCRKPTLQAIFWGFLFPAVVVSMSISRPIFLLFLLLYVVQFIKISFQTYGQLKTIRQTCVYSFFLVIGKLPQFLGMLIFTKRHLLQTGYTILEYN
jgi:GT2 family glycosyltransferase